MARLFVLGGADPEMETIHGLLTTAGEAVAQATAGGRPVHGGNAYKADGLDGLPGGSLEGFDEVVLVECDLPGWFQGDPAPRVVRVDHHRPGDPGFGRPPADALEASSIGQIMALLGPKVFWAALRTTMTAALAAAAPDRAVEIHPEAYVVGLREAVSRARLIAAADHCLEAAYRGRCPGVDPEELMKWRVESRAASQKRAVEAVLADVETARTALRLARQDAERVAICRRCGHRRDQHFPVGTCPPDENGLGDYAEVVADLRDRQVPELPEAACRDGVPYLATVTEPGGRRKVVLGAAGPELVRRFLAGQVVPGLTGYYGDPARGFAGGYLP